MPQEKDAWVKGWVELGERLRRTSVDEFEDVSGLVEEIVEAQEVISGHEHLLPLRPRRTMKLYSA